MGSTFQAIKDHRTTNTVRISTGLTCPGTSSNNNHRKKLAKVKGSHAGNTGNADLESAWIDNLRREKSEDEKKKKEGRKTDRL
jgi:hypothetical protein